VGEVPETRDSLLVRVKDPADSEAWEQFARIYRPVVYRLACGRGLQDAALGPLGERAQGGEGSTVLLCRIARPKPP
jgi:hypothetical protein